MGGAEVLTRPQSPGHLVVPALLRCLADFVAVFVTVTALTLGAWATVPVALTSLSATVVMSASMTPLIRPGDVVLMTPPSPEDVRRGAVVQYDDPSRPSRPLLHRVARVTDTATVVTKGDANRVPDAPIAWDDIDGVGRILVPFAGHPALWLRTGEAAQFLLWLTVTAAAAAWVAWRCPRVFVTTRARPVHRRRVRRVAALPFTGLLIVVLVAPHASAAWAAHTSAAAAYAAAQLLPPTNVQAEGACSNGAGGVQLEWTAAEGVSHYEIERRSLVTWQPVETTTGTTYFDQVSGLNLTLQYRIRSRAGGWSSDWSALSNSVTPRPSLLCL